MRFEFSYHDSTDAALGGRTHDGFRFREAMGLAQNEVLGVPPGSTRIVITLLHDDGDAIDPLDWHDEPDSPFAALPDRMLVRLWGLCARIPHHYMFSYRSSCRRARQARSIVQKFGIIFSGRTWWGAADEIEDELVARIARRAAITGRPCHLYDLPGSRSHYDRLMMPDGSLELRERAAIAVV